MDTTNISGATNLRIQCRKEIFKEKIVIAKLFDCLRISFRRSKEDLFFARNYFRGQITSNKLGREFVFTESV